MNPLITFTIPLGDFTKVRTVFHNLCYNLQTILSRFNIQQVNSVYLAFMYNNVQFCWIFKPHLTNSKRPKHYLQQVFITDVFVFFDACYS